MRVALILVKSNEYSFKNRPMIIRHQPDCLTLGMLYSIIKNSFPDIEIEIYDETVENIKKENINADIIGISAITPSYNRAVMYSKYFREKGIPTFLGGVHATLVPDKCFDDFDSVISGLANQSLPELIQDFIDGNLKQHYKQSENMSFEDFVYPSRHIYENKDFLATELDMVQATYGCSNICEFCVQPYMCNGYHKRPIDDVINEIKSITSDYIEFVDPNISKDLNYLKELCIKLAPLKKHWFAPMTISITKNNEILKLLQKAGCKGILIGFESVSPKSISAINKGFNQIYEYKEAVKTLHYYGIEVTGSFVIGLDGDNLETEENTLNFINDAKIDYVRFSVNTPYPGTEYFKTLEREKRILTTDWSLYDCHHCVFKPEILSCVQVEKIHSNLWKKSYSFINIIKRCSYKQNLFKNLKLIIKNYIFGKLYIKMNRL